MVRMRGSFDLSYYGTIYLIFLSWYYGTRHISFVSSRPPGLEHQILHPWVTVNLVVAVLVGLAWIFIALRPETDYTDSKRKRVCAQHCKSPKKRKNI